MITNAVQRGTYVYIYNERGVESACIPVGSSRGSGLKGFTIATVSIQQGSTIQTYDEYGHSVGSPIYAGPNEERKYGAGKGKGIGWLGKLIMIVAAILAIKFLL